MARTPEQLALKRLSDAAYRARARQKAQALGLSPSAALGKPNKGELTKSALGLDARTKAGREAAATRAQELGNTLPVKPPVQRLQTAAGVVAQSDDPQQLKPIINGLRGKKIQVTVTLEDQNGTRTNVMPWGRTGIRAEELRRLIREAGGNFAEAIRKAAESGKTADYGGLVTMRIVSVSVVYIPAQRKRKRKP